MMLFYLLAYLWLLWALYVLVMGLYRAKLDGRLGRTTKFLGAPFLAIGWLMDLIANMVVATVLFSELPRELLVTSRLSRHLRAGAGWRYEISRWVCMRLLDPFDPNGKHCL